MNRLSIMTGLSLLKEGGYRLPGYSADPPDAVIWHTVLAPYSDEQLRKAFKAVLDGHTFNEVKPAHVVQAIRDHSFHGTGRDGEILPLGGWHFWRSAKRREYAWHPAMRWLCDCPGCNPTREGTT